MGHGYVAFASLVIARLTKKFVAIAADSDPVVAVAPTPGAMVRDLAM
jgi:hypothetical protein